MSLLAGAFVVGVLVPPVDAGPGGGGERDPGETPTWGQAWRRIRDPVAPASGINQ